MTAARAQIRNNSTGEIRWYEHHTYETLGEDERSAIDYLWSEGNFACDCNRQDLFARAGGEPDPPDGACSSHRFSVLRVETSTGEELYPGDADAVAKYQFNRQQG